MVTVGVAGQQADFICTGTNDDVTINSAIATASSNGGGTVLLLPGTYNVSNPITLVSKVTLQGSGPEATKISVATNFSYNTSFWVIGCAGSATTSVAIPLTADANIGDQTLTATTGSELSAISANDLVFLRSDGLWESDQGTITTKEGEYVKVLSVSGSTVNLYGVARGTYLQSDSAALYRMSFVTDVAVRDLSITQASPARTVVTTQASVTPFVSLQFVHRGLVSNCYLHDGDGPAITLYHSVNVTVEDNSIRNLSDDTANKYLGYGILIGGVSERCIARGNKVSTVRHGVDAGTSLSAASVTSGYGVARGISVVDNVVENATNACYSTHAGGEGWLFEGNVATDSLSYGFFMRAQACRIVGNTVEYCGDGIGIGDSSFNSSGGSAAGSLVCSNTIRKIKTQAITSAYQAIGVSTSTAATGQGILLGLTDNVVVANNLVSECDDAGIRLRLSAIRCQIVNNTVVDVNLANTSSVPGILLDANFSGSTASLTQSGSTTTLTGGSGFSVALVGRTITISGANTPANNGAFTITTFISATSVQWTNASGATDLNNGAISYWIEGSTDNYIAENVVINRSASSYEQNATGHAKYAVRDAGALGNVRNVYKNNTGIALETGLMSVNATSAFSAGNSVTEGTTLKTKAGVPTDADFVATPDNGTMALDTTDNLAYVRSGGNWLSIVTNGSLTTGTVSTSGQLNTKAPASGTTVILASRTANGLADFTVIGVGSSNQIFFGDGTNNGNIAFNTGSGGQLNLQSAGSTGIVFIPSATGTGFIQCVTGSTAFTIKQNDKTTNGGTGATTTIQAQNETGTTSTGGDLNLTSGTGTTAAGAVHVQTGGTNRFTALASGTLQIPGFSSAGLVHNDASGNLTTSTLVDADVSASAAIAVSKLAAGTSAQVLLNSATPTPTWTTVSGDVTISSTGATTVAAISGASPINITPNNLRWVIGATPTINQIVQTAGSTNGAAFTIQAQNATGVTSTGGQLILTSGTGTTAAGNVNVQTGGTTILSLQPTVVAIANTAITLQFANSVTSNATFKFQALASTSGGSGAAGLSLSVAAQAGQAATGASNNGGAGGTLQLAAGAGGTSGSATAGKGGAVQIVGAQRVSRITVTSGTYTVDTNSTTADYVILVNRAGAVTITLPTPTDGRVLKIKDASGAALTNNITISPSGADKIDGASSYVLNLNSAVIEITSDGTNWFVTGSYNGTVI